MDFGNLEARTNDENRPELKRAMVLVKEKIPEIEKLIREGHGPHYIRDNVFGKSISYSLLLAAYKKVSGRKLGYKGSHRMDISEYKGREDIPEYVIDAAIAHLGNWEEGDDDNYRFSRNILPKAIRKF